MALAAAETASQDGECDTASDIPEESLNPLFLSEYLFNQLQHYHGVIITGNASQLFESDADWGKSMRLSDSEALQFRVYPKGLLSSGTLLEAKKTVIMVASRRRSGVEKDSVTFAILWHPEVEQQRRHTITPFEELVTSTQTVSARCLHILLPSLFNHHDATHASATKAGTPHVSPYPVLDEKFFHAVRPSSFTVHRAVQVSDQTMLALTAAPGLSQFVVAGHLAGLQTDDPPHRACEPCAFSKWNEMTTNYAKGVVEKVGTAKGVSAMLSAVNTCDLLTCEGLLSVLSHSFVGGAMPDSLHSPNGVPLLIAFCTRLACYPERFGLAGGTNADQMACKEVVSMFESSWEPICPVQAGTRNVYSIDLVIKSAYTEARQAARKESTTQAVEDNLLFWQRAGQRCITALFSCQVEDFVVPRCAFGHCARLQDPLDAARAAVVQKQFSPFDAVTGGAGAVSTALCSLQHRKTMLLTVLSSVEQWLRTGSYCSMQLHKKNDPKPSTRTMMSKNELTSAVNSGIEASVKELMDSGEYEDEECAREAAQMLADGIQAAFGCIADGVQIDLDAMGFKGAMRERLSNSVSKKMSMEQKRIESEEWTGVCLDAFNHGKSALAASLCQGPILTHQFDLGCYISSPHATNLCADCDADVHVLQATFLSSENSSCPICFRPRCVPCTAMMHSRGRPVREPAARHCKRCRPVAPGPQKPHVREKPLAPVPAFQGKVSPPTNPKKKAGK